jgi:hypothetical protein
MIEDHLICEAALSRTEEECDLTVRGVRVDQSTLSAERTCCFWHGLSTSGDCRSRGEPPKRAGDRENRIRTLALALLNTYYLEDMGLFRVSLKVAYMSHRYTLKPVQQLKDVAGGGRV